jgi:hypothetical protein
MIWRHIVKNGLVRHIFEGGTLRREFWSSSDYEEHNTNAFCMDAPDWIPAGSTVRADIWDGETVKYIQSTTIRRLD